MSTGETLQLDVRVRRGPFTLSVAETLPLAGVTAVFGPSGSGKTTLLRALAGLEPAEGRLALGDEVLLDSRQRVRVPAHRRGIAVAFQDARLFPHRDVAGNLRYAWQRAPRERGEDGWFDDVVNCFDLAPLLPRHVGGLSGGERQRVALARALLSRPRLLLLDEPLSALDVARKAEILPCLEALTQRFALPLLYVTHAVDEVARLADRMLVLDGGRCRALGATPEILDRLDLEPLTGRHEAGVLLTARVAAWDERYALLTLRVGDGLALVVPTRTPPAPGTSLRVRVLARDVALAREAPRAVSVRNVLAGRVADLTAHDEQSPFVDVRVDVGVHHLRARVTRASAEELALQPGTRVYAMIKSVSLEPAWRQR